MKSIQLSGSLRANVGKKDAKAVRNSERVPCVIYGSGNEQIYFSVRSVDIEKIIFSPNLYKVELDIEGTKKLAVIQERQMHPITDKPVHVDFLELSDDKEVKVRMPVRFVGRAKGVVSGGNMVTNFRTLRVSGLHNELPEEIEIDVTPLRIGKSIRVKNLEIPGIKRFLEDSNAVIVAVKTARGAVSVEEDDEDDEDKSEATESTETAEN